MKLTKKLYLQANTFKIYKYIQDANLLVVWQLECIVSTVHADVAMLGLANN